MLFRLRFFFKNIEKTVSFFIGLHPVQCLFYCIAIGDGVNNWYAHFIELYKIGSSNNWNGANIFWYIDKDNNVICPACGLVNDYTVTEKSNNSVCTCNGCGKFLGNKPKDITGLRMPFGKYKHRLIKDVALLDLPYLSWFLRECHEKLSDNTIYALKYYLNIR